MKTSRAGIVSAAILIVMAGLGFGIAQAGGDQLDNRASTLEKCITEYPNYEVATSSADDIQLASGDQEFVPEYHCQALIADERAGRDRRDSCRGL